MARRLRLAVVAAGGIALLTGVGACTSSHGSASGGVNAAGAVPGAPHAAASAAAGATGGRAAPSAGRPGAQTADLEIGTAKIRTVDMTVQVRRGTTVAGQANTAEAIATGAGGEVDADERTSGEYAQATLVLRVPPEQLTATLDQLSRLGIERSRRLLTQDVTAKVADVNSRVASAQGAIARLRVLYRRAVRIADVIDIESELAQRESDLESLQAQQRALSAETATAAITLTLTGPPRKIVPVHKKAHHEHGFVAGLRGGWHAFATGAVALATVLGAVLPFAALLAVLGVAVRWLWPRLRPRRVPAPTPPQ